MASVKRIGYDQIRGADPNYLHRYVALGLDGKANINAEKVLYTPKTVNSDSVLLYKGDNHLNSINLFPFVIDFNALTFEQGVKICFYQSTHFEGDSLDFLFLEDNSVINIEKRGILKPDTNFNDLMMDEKKRKTLNLDNVLVGFQEIKKKILK